MITNQISKRDRNVGHNRLTIPRTFNQVFDNFRQNMENLFFDIVRAFK